MKSLRNQFSKVPRQNRNASFTLIELLVVIAIIAILASMLLPALSKARMAAQKSKCSSNMKQFGVMSYMYAQDFNERLPDIIAVNVGTVAPWSWEGTSVTSLRNDYGLKWSMMCPMVTDPNFTNGNFDAFVNSGIPGASPVLYGGPQYYYGVSPWPKLGASSLTDKPQKLLWCDMNRLESGNAQSNNHPDLSMNVCKLDGSVKGYNRGELCSDSTHGWGAFWSSYVCLLPKETCPECSGW